MHGLNNCLCKRPFEQLSENPVPSVIYYGSMDFSKKDKDHIQSLVEKCPWYPDGICKVFNEVNQQMMQLGVLTATT